MGCFKWGFYAVVLLAFPIVANCELNEGTKGERVEIQKIVVAKDASPWQALAVEELGHYLNLITNKKIPVEEIALELRSPEKGSIYLGNAAKQVGLINASDIAKLEIDGYVLVCQDGSSGIFSDKEAGELYGVYRFLEEIGWKYYGSDCEVIPKTAQMPDRNICEVRSPFFQLRIIEPAFDDFYAKNYKDCALTRFGFSVAPTSGLSKSDKKLSVIPHLTWGVSDWRKAPASDTWLHTIPSLIPAEAIKVHTEFLARDANGKPIPESGHLCLSNQKLVEILKIKVDEWMKNCDTGEFFSVSHPDHAGWCECNDCIALDPIKKAKKQGLYTPFLTDRLLHCVNQVADYERQKHPDKIILSLSYTASTEPPPLKTKPADNVRMLLCPYTAGGAECQTHDLTCPRNSEFLKHFNDWRKVAPNQLYIFDYPMNYSRIYAPFFSHDAMIAKIRFFHANNVRGLWYCGMPRLMGGLFCYIQAKLLWNPELSDGEIAELENEYFAAYYGTAAGDLKRLLALLRKVNHDPIKPAHQGCDSNACELSRSDYIPEAYAIMDAAEKSVVDNPTFRKRVSLEKVGAVLWLDLDTGFTQNESERYLRLAELIRFLREDQASDKRHLGNPVWLKSKYRIALDLKKEKLQEAEWYKAGQLDALAKCRTIKDAAGFMKSNLTYNEFSVRTKDGIEIFLDGFQPTGSTFGPFLYSYACPPAMAIGICGGGKLKTNFNLSATEIADTFLVLESLDNDKPGKTRIRIDVNGTTIFSGANQAAKNNWTELRFPVKKELLTQNNCLEITDLEEDLPNANWFAFRKSYIAPLPLKWQPLKEWNFSGKSTLSQVISWCEQDSSCTLSIDDKTRTPGGNASLLISILKIKKNAAKSSVQVWFPAREALKKGERYKIFFWLMASRRQDIAIASIVEKPGFPTVGESASSEVLVEDKKWAPAEIDFVADADYQDKIRVPNLCLATGEGDQFWIGDVRFEKYCK